MFLKASLAELKVNGEGAQTPFDALDATNSSIVIRHTINPPCGGNEMRKPSTHTRAQSTWNEGGDTIAVTAATETDPLLQASAPSFFAAVRASQTVTRGSSIRSRKSSRSPTGVQFGSSAGQEQAQMNTASGVDPTRLDLGEPYNLNPDDDASSGGDSSRQSIGSNHTTRSLISLRRKARAEKLLRNHNANSNDHPPLLEIPEEVYAVRKSALQVMKPLTKTWVSH